MLAPPSVLKSSGRRLSAGRSASSHVPPQRGAGERLASDTSPAPLGLFVQLTGYKIGSRFLLLSVLESLLPGSLVLSSKGLTSYTIF